MGNKSKRDNASKRSCQSQMPSVPSQDSSSRIRTAVTNTFARYLSFIRFYVEMELNVPLFYSFSYKSN